MHYIYITLPQIQYDWYLGLTAVAFSVAYTSLWTYKSVGDPKKTVADLGYANATADASFPALVHILRMIAGVSLLSHGLAFYFWHTISLTAAVWFLFLFDIPQLLAMIYRGYFEDASSGSNSAKSAENSRKNLRLFGVKAGLLFLAGLVFYMEFYNGLDYVDDNKHGLPENLTMMLGVVKNKFMKGSHH